MNSTLNTEITSGRALYLLMNDLDPAKLKKIGIIKSVYSLVFLMKQKVFPLNRNITLEEKPEKKDLLKANRIVQGAQAATLWKIDENATLDTIEENLKAYYSEHYNDCYEQMRQILSCVKYQSDIERLTRELLTAIALDDKLDLNIKFKLNNTVDEISINDIRSNNLPEVIDVAVLLTDVFLKLIRHSSTSPYEEELLNNKVNDSYQDYNLHTDIVTEDKNNITTKLIFMSLKRSIASYSKEELQFLLNSLEYKESKTDSVKNNDRWSLNNIQQESEEIIKFIYSHFMKDAQYILMERHLASNSRAIDFYENKSPNGYYEKLFIPICDKCLGFAIEYNYDRLIMNEKIINKVRLIFGIHQTNPLKRLSDEKKNLSKKLEGYFASIGKAYRIDTRKGYSSYCANHDHTTEPSDSSIVNREYWGATMTHTILGTKIEEIKQELEPYIGDIKGALKSLYDVKISDL